MAHATLLVLFLVAAFQQGTAIKCYQCSSMTNKACKDPMMMSGDIKPVDCTPSLAWSSKSLNDVLPGSVSKLLDSIGSSISNVANNAEMICMKTNVKSGEEVVVMRNCAFAVASSDTSAPKGSGVCDQIKKASDGKAEFCGVCDTDGCNSAPHHAVTSIMVLLAPLIALFLKL